MSKKLKWIVFSLLGLIVLLVLLKRGGVFGGDEGTKVSSEKVQKKTIIETVTASGKVYPEIEVKMSPDISGEIIDLYVEEGDSVKKGTVLARIYADIYTTQRDEAAAQVNIQQATVANASAALESLKAQLDQAQKTFDMQKELYDQKVISRAEFNTAESAMRSAQANYNAAKQNIRGGEASVTSARAGLSKANKDLSRATLVSPMDGIVSLLNVKKGERVVGNSMMAGTEMMRIADLSRIEVRVDVGENDIPKVHIGDSVDVEVEAYTNRKFKGFVTQIASSNTGAATAVTGTSDVTQYKVYIRLVPESYKDLIDPAKPKSFPFRPGMSASADIKTKKHANVLAVPINSVTTRDKGDTLNAKNYVSSKDKKEEDQNEERSSDSDDDLDVVVFVITPDQTVKRVIVRTDIQDINYIEILSGLKEGEAVVTGPYEVVSKTLKPGDKVKVVPKEDLFEKK